MKTAVENELELKKIEISVIKLIIAEKPNKEIAKSLNYSQRNVEYIISGLCEKWNVVQESVLFRKHIKEIVYREIKPLLKGGYLYMLKKHSIL
ncbi:helix-turn-helix transcriptional regulator [Bacillus siamensis]|uniref:helix-turn-helix transcriptional regulator n=1 Tax=Bacillus siamensis TaxID=659243 RepID=UPI001F520F75|nr:LuxR C-terminal-related transcriptional regulator [Bacillus siamensis]